MRLLTSHEIVAAAKPVRRKVAGIYFLLGYRGRSLAVLYVGRSVDVAGRIRQHQSDGTKLFSHYAVVECRRATADELTALEGAYIDALKPPYNTGVPKGYGRYNSLTRQSGGQRFDHQKQIELVNLNDAL